MKKRAMLLALSASALFAQAPRKITVRQLEQVLAWQREHHVDDGTAARQLESAELTEQLTDLRMTRFEAEFQPGKQAMESLHLLADLSAFLSPPASELPHQDAPDAAEQQRMIQSAVKFAAETLHHLPDFLATRTTQRFEDVPVITRRRAYQSDLHLSGTFVRETAYRGGREVNPDALLSSALPDTDRKEGDSLNSIGEFGQVLAIILRDSAHGTMTWKHWQQTPAGQVAVFNYGVPKRASHYRVHFCCEWSRVNHTDSFEGMPAYRGSLSIDPASGAVLSLTLVADFEGFAPPPIYELVVNYARIEIGRRSAILPIRSAVVGEEITPGKKQDLVYLHINDVSFTNYHRFGSTVKILPAAQNR